MKSFLKKMQAILSGAVLADPKVRHYYPFLLFLAVLGIFYIANTYVTVHTLREIEKTEKNLKTAKDELKKQEVAYNKNILQTKLVENLKEQKIKEADKPIMKIIID